jgi:tryptophanyl-tRNA synthetase
MSKAEVLRAFGGHQFSSFKAALSDVAVAKLSPIASRMKAITADPAYIDTILADGAARAGVIAEATLREVKSIVGFLG